MLTRLQITGRVRSTMRNVHVVSCGASVLGAVYRERTAIEGLGGFTGSKLEDLVRYLLDNDRARGSTEAAGLDKPEWFAELTAMRVYLDRRAVDLAYLVSTRTQASRLCADWLARYLRDRAGIIV